MAKWLPVESLLLETDAYPQPFKKKRENWTEPRHVREVAELLTRLKGVSPEEVAHATSSNLVRMCSRSHLGAARTPALAAAPGLAAQGP
jgi:TatD DNase family protein